MEAYRVFSNLEYGRYRYYQYSHNRPVSALMAKALFGKVCLWHLEIPLTTCCTLCCGHCANLMQYYSEPKHGSAEQIIGSLAAILSCIDGIALLRLLGGEPLLYPELYRVLDFCLKERKIKKIELVTNGTLLLPEDVLALLAGSRERKPDIKVCISDYGKSSAKKDLLAEQLCGAGVAYTVESGKWWAAGDISRRGRDTDFLKDMFRKCHKCVSLLNGELHICPRSSHGTQLHIVAKKQGEYVAISEYGNDGNALRAAIRRLLSREYVEACNYCDGDRPGLAGTVPAGEQASRAECLAYLRDVRSRDRAPEQGGASST